MAHIKWSRDARTIFADGGRKTQPRNSWNAVPMPSGVYLLGQLTTVSCAWFAVSDPAKHLLFHWMLVSWGCPNNLPWSWWLERIETYSLTVQEREVWNQGVSRAMLTQGKSLPCLFQFLVVASKSWLVDTSLQPLSPSSHHLLPMRLPFSGHLSLDLGPTLTQDDLILNP